jgi:hypothetical protein
MTVTGTIADGTIAGVLLSIPISTEAEVQLRARASAAGVDLATYVGSLVEETARPPLTLEEISGPIADDFAATGMTEDELGDLLEEAKHEMRAERRNRRAS